MKILYLTRNDGTEYRGVKICNTLAQLGHDVIFVGWDRTPEKPKDLNFDPGVRLRILPQAGVFAKNSFHGWGSYCRHVARCLREEKPDAVQAVNEEKAILVLPFKGWRYRHLVIDVYDSVTANKYRTWWLNLAARLCRAIGNAGADAIIETGPELRDMLGRRGSKCVIIENSPHDPGAEWAARVPTEGPTRLALGGFLSKRRMGLEPLIGALDLLPKGSVVVEATGWLVDEYAQDVFAKHPAVNYRWLPKATDFLKIASECDALLYLRSDAHESAYRAAVRPNRIFDAMSVGRPVIVNAELAIARWVERDKLGLVVPRLDPESIAAAIRLLPDRRCALAEQAQRMRAVFLGGHVWPVMERRLATMYAELAAGRAPTPTRQDRQPAIQ